MGDRQELTLEQMAADVFVQLACRRLGVVGLQQVPQMRTRAHARTHTHAHGFEQMQNFVATQRLLEPARNIAQVDNN